MDSPFFDQMLEGSGYSAAEVKQCIGASHLPRCEPSDDFGFINDHQYAQAPFLELLQEAQRRRIQAELIPAFLKKFADTISQEGNDKLAKNVRQFCLLEKCPEENWEQYRFTNTLEPNASTKYLLENTILCDSTVLDIGSGNGRDVCKVAKEGARRVIGVEASQFMLELAKKNIEELDPSVQNRILLVRSSLEEFLSHHLEHVAEADVVTANSVFQLITDEQFRFFLNKMHSVLEPGSTMSISLKKPNPNWKEDELLIQQKDDDFILLGTDGRGRHYRQSKTVEGILRDEGFDIDSTVQVTQAHASDTPEEFNLIISHAV